MNVAFAGAFSARMAERVQAHLGIPCDVILADEAAIVPRMPEVDVLVTLAFTPAMGAAARRLKLVQVPGAGLDRIDRAALPPGASAVSMRRSGAGRGKASGRSTCRRRRCGSSWRGRRWASWAMDE